MISRKFSVSQLIEILFCNGFNSGLTSKTILFHIKIIVFCVKNNELIVLYRHNIRNQRICFMVKRLTGRICPYPFWFINNVNQPILRIVPFRQWAGQRQIFQLSLKHVTEYFTTYFFPDHVKSVCSKQAYIAI